MTLFRQLLVVILLSLLVNLVGVLWLNFDSTRNYLTNQLESDIDNTMTSLGMSLQPHLQQRDTVMLESIIKAYFDSGYYQQISLTFLDNDEVITFEVSPQIHKVPHWFTELALIQVTEKQSVITNGWLQVANLKVVGHPGFAYVQLWQSLVNFMSLFAGLALIISALAAIGIKRILTPLMKIRQKAIALQKQQFSAPIALPKTTELRDVVAAVNLMSDRIQSKFEYDARLHEELKSQAYRDPTTGLGNRAFLTKQLEAVLAESAEGYFGIVSIAELDKIKQKHGFAKRDEVVVQAANSLSRYIEKLPDCACFRISLHEFALLLPTIDQHQMQQLLKQWSGEFAAVDFVAAFSVTHPVNIGITELAQAEKPTDLLLMADNALMKAASQESHTYILSTQDADKVQLQRNDVRNAIVSAIRDSAIDFVKQPVLQFAESVTTIHSEVFAKLSVQHQGQWLPAATFISVMDEFNLGTEFDKKTISLLLAQIEPDSNQRYAINLSASALTSEDFISWLEALLPTIQQQANIHFEFSEESVVFNKDNILRLVSAFKRHHVGFGIDRVARNFSSLSYLKEIQPDYVKIDPVFTRMAMSGDSDAYFVSSLCSAIHNLNIQIIASHVETAEQRDKMASLRFDGYQGFINKPSQF